MNLKSVGNVALRVLVLAVGYCVFYGVLFAAGKLLVPLTDSADKAILAFINPDSYVPFFDELFRAINDYTNPVIVLPFLCWMVVYGLYRLSPKQRLMRYFQFAVVLMALAGLLHLAYGEKAASAIKALVALTAGMPLLGLLPRSKKVLAIAYAVASVALFAVMFKSWENKVYMGANVLMVLMCLAGFGTYLWLFCRMDDETMRCFSRVFWLVLLAGILTDFGITQPIKEAIHRPRPFNDANKPWNEQVRPIPEEVLKGANSFPSGHTSGTFALLTPLFWFTRNRKVRVGLMVWASLQGLGRVYTAAHFPFCVLMGGLLGFGMGTLIFFTLWGTSLWPKREEETQPA